MKAGSNGKTGKEALSELQRKREGHLQRKEKCWKESSGMFCKHSEYLPCTSNHANYFTCIASGLYHSLSCYPLLCSFYKMSKLRFI